MIHLLGAIACCVISVHCLRMSFAILSTNDEIVPFLVSIFFAAVGILAGIYAVAAMNEFTEVMGWK